ncbi:MAG TPA: glycosyltransferase family 4 protein [Haliangium sp.]|nr:glycosyltransferase family 4 protein [Haliangium sp.]
MRARPLIFVLPAESGLISGGNIYNERLIAALAPLCAVRTLSVGEGVAAMRAGEPGTFFVDTLNLGDFVDLLAQPHARQHRILIVHHLPSLEPGIAAVDPSLAIEREALPRFDGFLTTSAYTTSLLRARGHAAQAMITVPPALPARERQALRCPPVMRGLLVGNLIPRKGVLPLLQALDAAVTPDDRFDIDIVGGTGLDPAYAEACVQLAASSPRLGPRVHLHGEVPHAEMDAYYGAASVMISASSMETFGMALQEARAWGLPILACDGGNSRNHFVSGENGELYATVPALAHDVLALARGPGRLRRLFARAQDMRAGAEYTWDSAARALLDSLAAQLPYTGP